MTHILILWFLIAGDQVEIVTVMDHLECVEAVQRYEAGMPVVLELNNGDFVSALKAECRSADAEIIEDPCACIDGETS